MTTITTVRAERTGSPVEEARASLNHQREEFERAKQALLSATSGSDAGLDVIGAVAHQHHIDPVVVQRALWSLDAEGKLELPAVLDVTADEYLA